MPPRNKVEVSIADGLSLNKTEAMEQILDRLEALTDKRYVPTFLLEFAVYSRV